MNKPRQYLTPKQAARFLKVPVGTLSSWRSRSIGPTWHKIGRHARYTRHELIEWTDQVLRGGIPSGETIQHHNGAPTALILEPLQPLEPEAEPEPAIDIGKLALDTAEYRRIIEEEISKALVRAAARIGGGT